MQASEDVRAILELTETTTADALQIFDALEPVDLDFMLGRWRGFGLQTAHPMDGLLEVTNWYGKEFINSECVHPFLCHDRHGRIIKVAPNPMVVTWALKFPIPRTDLLQPLLGLARGLLETKTSQARLRMMAYRGKVSATMLYDYLPIADSFRKLDGNAVMGAMDFKALPQPFFFFLKRCSPE